MAKRREQVACCFKDTGFPTGVVDCSAATLIFTFMDFAYRLPRGNCPLLTACRKEARASCPFQLTGDCPLEGITLASRLAASRNHKHSR